MEALHSKHASWKAQVPGAVITFNHCNLQSIIILGLYYKLHEILQMYLFKDTVERKSNDFRDIMHWTMYEIHSSS